MATMTKPRKRKPAPAPAPEPVKPPPWPERLRALREKLGARDHRRGRISQRELAELLGVSLRSVVYWEKGEQTPIPPVAILIDQIEKYPENFGF